MRETHSLVTGSLWTTILEHASIPLAKLYYRIYELVYYFLNWYDWFNRHSESVFLVDASRNLKAFLARRRQECLASNRRHGGGFLERRVIDPTDRHQDPRLGKRNVERSAVLGGGEPKSKVPGLGGVTRASAAGDQWRSKRSSISEGVWTSTCSIWRQCRSDASLASGSSRGSRPARTLARS